MTDWAEHAIWWHVYPLGFVGAPPTPEGADEAGRATESPGPLRRIGAWLDYVVELGANGLLLGPVFASETHGYDTVDYYRVDPRLGSEDDLRRLVDEAHARGIRVLLDGVFNHVGRGFPAFADVAARGEGSPYAGWFRQVGDEPGGGPAFATFEGHDRLVELNHDEPAVADHVVEVMCHWLAAGVDGWRLDAAYAVPNAFWRTVSDRVRARHPQAWLVGEVIHGDYAAVVAEGGLDSVTEYELWKAVWSSLNDVNLYELAWTLQRHDDFVEAFLPLTFVGNHDVTRIASRLTDRRHLPHALVVLFTVGGVPAVYYGDEQGLAGVKEERAGGDDAVRPEFPAEPRELTEGGWETYRLHQELIALRRRHAWLVRARTAQVELRNEVLAYESQGAGSGERLLTVLNLGDEPARVPGGGAEWRVEAGAAEVSGDAVIVPPHGWVIAASGGVEVAGR